MRKINAELKKQIERKLRSSSGASIFFALLIFLVCAAIGSVVLTAGTAASGRMSKTAEMDQRFYAVQSAAKFFKNQLDGQSVSIVRERTTTEEEYTLLVTDENGKVTSTPDGSSDPGCEYDLRWSDGTPVSSGQSLLQDAAIELLLGQEVKNASNANAAAAAAWGSVFPAFTVSMTNPAPSWSMQIDPAYGAGTTEPSLEALKINVTCELSADGTLKLTFTSPGSGDKYSTELTLTAVVDEGRISTSSSVSSIVTPVSGIPNTKRETLTKTTVDTRVSTLTWSFASASIANN